jgi:hypothetical protein
MRIKSQAICGDRNVTTFAALNESGLIPCYHPFLLGVFITCRHGVNANVLYRYPNSHVGLSTVKSVL